jgi:hypothetical protein
LQSASNAWRDTSKYITLEVGEEIDLRFHPDIPNGIEVKQDTYMGEPTGYKTFYQVKDVNIENQDMRIFKANRKSTKLINAELARGNWTLRIKRVGSGKDTVYQPTATTKL